MNTIQNFTKIVRYSLQFLVYKLNGKVIRSLKECKLKIYLTIKYSYKFLIAKIEEYELKIKLSSARIKIETLTEMEFGSDLSS